MHRILFTNWPFIAGNNLTPVCFFTGCAKLWVFLVGSIESFFKVNFLKMHDAKLFSHLQGCAEALPCVAVIVARQWPRIKHGEKFDSFSCLNDSFRRPDIE